MLSGTPMFDMLKFREGFNPLEDVEYETIQTIDGKIVREIPFFGGTNEWHK